MVLNQTKIPMTFFRTEEELTSETTHKGCGLKLRSFPRKNNMYRSATSFSGQSMDVAVRNNQVIMVSFEKFYVKINLYHQNEDDGIVFTAAAGAV